MHTVYGNEVNMCFVDYKKGIRQSELEYHESFEENRCQLELIANLYIGQTALVRKEDELPASGIIGRGVRQGCHRHHFHLTFTSRSCYTRSNDWKPSKCKYGGKWKRYLGQSTKQTRTYWNLYKKKDFC